MRWVVRRTDRDHLLEVEDLAFHYLTCLHYIARGEIPDPVGFAKKMVGWPSEEAANDGD